MKLTPLEPWILQKIGSPQAELGRSDLEAYQVARLRQVLELARSHSTFYRKHLAAAPESIARLSDLAQFPFTSAEDLRREGLQFLCVSQSEIRRVVTLDTSGTTGSPKRLYFTRQDQELTIDFFRQGMSTFTNPGDRVMILLPYQTPDSVGDLLATGLRRLGATPIPYGPVQDPQEALAVMQAQKADVLVGVPTHILAMARFWQSAHPQQGKQPHSVLLTTDHVPGAIVSALETAWGCRVYNHFGMTEMGLGGGVECAARRGYHLREADLYFEIVNPATGEGVAEGETGEMVFTTLTRQGMPLIRYRTGDLSRWLPGPCACGTVLKTLERVTHRIAGRIPLRRSGEGGFQDSERPGNAPWLTMAELDEAIFPIPGVLNFTARLSPLGAGDCLDLEVYVLPPAAHGIEARVLRALQGTTGLAGAIQAGTLLVRVKVEEYRKGCTGSMKKRAIFHETQVTFPVSKVS
jgi:phenylacetate-CoA ligase